MRTPRYTRRKFLGTASVGAASTLLVNPLNVAEAKASSLTNAIPANGEYALDPEVIYLNTGTLGPCRRDTMEASRKIWEELELLPLKFYGKWGAESVAENTRTLAASFLGCNPEEMMITSSTTSGMNAIAQGLRLKAGDRIITTDQEHGGGILCWNYYQKYYGVAIDSIGIPPGENNADMILNKISDAITKDTKLVSVSHVFSSTGLRVPIDKISALARSKGILCIVDGAQAAGAIKVNLKELGCHAYATSGHKWLMGPKGTGILYLSQETKDVIRPMQFEESHNTYNDSNGVVNQAAILGLAKAIEYIQTVGIDKIEEHNIRLRNRLHDQLSKIKGLKMMSPEPGALASPMIACELPDRFERTSFVKSLYDQYKISIRPTHKQWFNGIRFSMHIFNTEKEVDFAAGVVKKLVS
jgi:selenocysteine lyase/cysteine desulfurase